jgi:hypothetical protein
MIVCYNCQSNQLDGSIFCLECGASLIVETGQESTREIGAPAGPLTAGLSRQSKPAEVEEGSLYLTVVIAHNGHRYRLNLGDERLIGREDSNKGVQPDLDLGAEGGYDAGVSRRHAILLYRDGQYMVEDLGSANGTFVNGRRLASQAAMSLRNGDELKCGTMVLRVEIG